MRRQGVIRATLFLSLLLFCFCWYGRAHAEEAGGGALVQQEDGSYHYWIEGVFQPDFTGFFQHPTKENRVYYIKNGIWKSDTSGLVKRAEDDKWVYVKNGLLQMQYTGIYTNSRGKEYFLIKGVWERNYTGLTKRSADKQYVYVKKGEFQASFTGFFQHPANNKIYYLKNGLWQSGTTGLVKRASDGKWVYVKNGLLQTKYTGIYTNSRGKEYFLIKGVWERNYTGLTKRSTDKQYVYVIKGEFQASFTGFYKKASSGRQYYIKNGVWQDKTTGMVKKPADGKLYYVQNGLLKTGYTGMVRVSKNKIYYVVKGKWQENKTGLVSVGDQKLYVKKGYYKPSFTGIYKDAKGVRYYIRNGVWNTGFQGRITYGSYAYEVAGGKVVRAKKYTPLAKRKVILISIDGMRPDGFLQCGNAFVTKVLQKSRYTLSGRTVYPSWTFPVHYSVFHSESPSRHGITENYFRQPQEAVTGLMEHLQANGKSTAMFFGWDTMTYLAEAGSIQYTGYQDALALGGADHLLTQQALTCLAEQQPDFLFLYLVDTDDFGGHAHGWMSKKYLKQLSKAVDCVKQIYEAAGDRYTILIMSDHGGHGKNHGTSRPEDMTVPFFALGPDFKKGSGFQGYTVLDIAPTISELMGLAPDLGWEGHSLLR